MKNKKTGSLLGLVAGLWILSAQAHADIYNSLSQDDQDTVDSGEQVIQQEDVDGSAWPRVTILQRVDGTPEEAAGVMFDFSVHSAVFEGITQATPLSRGSAETDVNYVMTFPKVLGISLPDEHYTVHDSLTSFETSGFQVAWTFVKASSMLDTNGSAQFEPLAKGGTLLRYTNFIKPPRPALAGMIVNMAIGRVKSAAKGIVDRVASERANDPAKLNAQKAAVLRALGR